MNKALKLNTTTLILVMIISILTFTLYVTRRDMHRDLQEIAEMRQQIGDLQGAFKSLTRTEWTITDWRWSGTNGTDIASIVSDGGGRGSITLEVPVSHRLVEPLMLGMGRYATPKITVGKKLIFERPTDSYVPEQHIVFGGRLVASIK
jgi:hypothetical protein